MKYSNILVPLDYSGLYKPILKTATALQAASTANLILLHVFDYLPPTYIQPLMPAIIASEELMLERANEYFDSLIADFDLKDFKKILVTGKVTDQILDVIDQENIDLVVMGRHCQSGVVRLAGSNTNAIVQRAQCDVLVLHE